MKTTPSSPQLRFIRSESEDTLRSVPETLPDNDYPLPPLPPCIKKKRIDSADELIMNKNETKKQQSSSKTKIVRFSLQEDAVSESEWVLTNKLKHRLWWSKSEQKAFRIRREKDIAQKCTRSTIDNIVRIYDACRKQSSGNGRDNVCLMECLSLCSGDGRGLESQIYPAFGCDRQILRDEILRTQDTFSASSDVGHEERQAVLASISDRRSKHQRIFARLVAKGDSVALLNNGDTTTRRPWSAPRR